MGTVFIGVESFSDRECEVFRETVVPGLQNTLVTSDGGWSNSCIGSCEKVIIRSGVS